MADNRKYYYLKLKENFFDSDSIVLLEDMKDGILYSNILLKLYLKSLKNGGKLQLDEHIPYTAQMIATLTRHQIGTVERALEIFRQLGLVEQLDSGAFYMTDIELMIGQSSTEAERKRAARLENKALLPPRTKGGHLSDIRPPEIEIEKEIEIIHSHVSHDDVDKSHFEIIEYLNLKTGSKFKPTTKPYVQAIRSRLKEGYTVDDFKTVIDKKCREWKGTKLEKYLTPKTLFAPSHFDTYLNSNEMATMTDTERKVAELNALIDAVERETDETGNIESYGPTIDISEY